MPQFQLRFGPPSNVDPETLVAADMWDAIGQARHRLAAEGVSHGMMLLDGVVLQTFGMQSELSHPGETDMSQLFAAAGIYVFKSANPIALKDDR